MDGQRLLQEIGAISARATPGRSGPAQRPFDDSTAVESKERSVRCGEEGDSAANTRLLLLLLLLLLWRLFVGGFVPTSYTT